MSRHCQWTVFTLSVLYLGVPKEVIFTLDLEKLSMIEEFLLETVLIQTGCISLPRHTDYVIVTSITTNTVFSLKSIILREFFDSVEGYIC